METLIIVVVVALLLWFLSSVKRSNSSKIKQESEPSYVVTVTEAGPSYIFNPTKKNREFIRALIFMGKADGQFREPECCIVRDFLVSAQPEHKETPLDYIISSVREVKSMSAAEYRGYLDSLTDIDLYSLLDWSKKITDTQKTRHPFEDYLLDDIRTRISIIEANTLTASSPPATL